MNYLDLSTRLSHLAEKLSKQATKIEGHDVAKSAMKLVSELDRFEAVLESYLASRKSGEFFLETLLRSPSAKRHLSLDLLKKGLLETVHAQDKSAAAAKFLKHSFAEAASVASGGKDKASLQQEFIQLGRLSEEEFAKAIAKRTFGELRRLAGNNAVRFTDKTTKPRLIQVIRRFSVRAAINATPIHLSR
jgi:SOS response regulatory protein OraA/RecX